MKASDDFLSVAQAGDLLGVTRRHVHNLMADGLLPAVRIGRAFAIRRADLAKIKPRKPGPKPKGSK